MFKVEKRREKGRGVRSQGGRKTGWREKRKER